MKKLFRKVVTVTMLLSMLVCSVNAASTTTINYPNYSYSLAPIVNCKVVDNNLEITRSSLTNCVKLNSLSSTVYSGRYSNDNGPVCSTRCVTGNNANGPYTRYSYYTHNVLANGSAQVIYRYNTMGGYQYVGLYTGNLFIALPTSGGTPVYLRHAENEIVDVTITAGAGQCSCNRETATSTKTYTGVQGPWFTNTSQQIYNSATFTNCTLKGLKNNSAGNAADYTMHTLYGSIAKEVIIDGGTYTGQPAHQSARDGPALIRGKPSTTTSA